MADVVPSLNLAATNGTGIWVIGGGATSAGAGCFLGIFMCVSGDDGLTFVPLRDIVTTLGGSVVAGITYNPNTELFAAVGLVDNNWITESYEPGDPWVQKSNLPTITNTGSIKSFIFADNIFMVAGVFNNAPYIATSPDLDTWTVQTLTSPGTTINCLAFFNGSFYAGGSGGALFVSADVGVTWAPVTTPFSTGAVNILSLAASGSVIIATGGTGTDRSMFSSDGVTWALSNLNALLQFFGSAFANGIFVTGNPNNQSIPGIYTSTDGDHWNAFTILAFFSMLALASSSSGTFVGCGNILAGSGIAIRSTDGENWVQCNIVCTVPNYGPFPIPIINIIPNTSGGIWFALNNGHWNNNPHADPASNIGGFPLTLLEGQAVYPTLQGSGDFIETANFGAQTFAFTPPAGFTGCPGSLTEFTTLDPDNAYGSGNGLSGGNLTVFFNTVPGMVQAVDGYTSGKYYYELIRGKGDVFNIFGGGGAGANYKNSGNYDDWISSGSFSAGNVAGGVLLKSNGLVGTFGVVGFGSTLMTNIFSSISVPNEVYRVAFIVPSVAATLGKFMAQMF
jgi:hypothetical protein